MDIINGLILGIVQGLTEFLPVSSSGHLVIMQHLLGYNPPGILMEVAVHLGTLLSILIYFRDDFKKLLLGCIQRQSTDLSMVNNIIMATLPTVIVGLLFKDEIESLFSIQTVPLMLILTGLILLSTRFVSSKGFEISIKVALLIGFAQVLAMIPGISRSGITITAALWLGISRDKSSRFSFFMAIPVLIGAGILQLWDLSKIAVMIDISIIIGFLSASVVGYFVIDWLLKLISKDKFWVFSVYCILAGTGSFILIK